MTDTTRARAAAAPPPGGYPVPGAIGALATVDVTVSALPTAVNEADVERRLLAFQERLRVPARAAARRHDAWAHGQPAGHHR